MDQDFKDYTLFKAGSYWIYKDSATGAIDSINLYKSNIYISPGSDKIRYNSEVYEISLTSSIDDTLISGSGKTSPTDPYAYNLGRLHDYQNIIAYFFSTTGLSKGHQYHYLIYTDLYDSLKVFNQFYKDVIIFENTYNPATYLPRKIFYSKNVGIIRKELYNGQVWNLVRYHVSQ
jgi:hypothetical protein